MWLAQSMKQAVPTADADQGISTIVGDQNIITVHQHQHYRIPPSPQVQGL